jgi:GH25 family lysozyme M1 (1,4-beta-N-acetylmuramidase)
MRFIIWFKKLFGIALNAEETVYDHTGPVLVVSPSPIQPPSDVQPPSHVQPIQPPPPTWADTPSGALLKGGDFSHYQTRIDTKLYPAMGNSFLITKASDGLGTSDPFFHTAREDAHKMGLPFIGYHFFRFGVNPLEQARLLFKTFSLINANEGVAGDYEWDDHSANGLYGGGKQTDAHGNDLFYIFKSEVEQLFGVPMIIYTGRSFMPMVDKRFTKNPLWVFDRHTTNRQLPHAGQNPILPPTWDNWAFWQYSDRAQTAGSGAIDMNVFSGSLAQLNTILKK